jgi:hypothetical protein
VSRETALGLYCGAPALLLSVALIVLMGVGAAGVRPFQPLEPLTLAELIAVGDRAGIIRTVRLGVNPNDPSPVRAGILGSRLDPTEPLEIAIIANQIDALRLLVELGAVVHRGNFGKLWCLARQGQNTDAMTAVAAALPDGPPVQCSNAVR